MTQSEDGSQSQAQSQAHSGSGSEHGPAARGTAVPSCVRYYRRIRAAPNPAAVQIGSGRNLREPSPLLLEGLTRTLGGFLGSGRVMRYDSSHDTELRGVAAELFNLYLDTRYAPDDVFFINGSTEGIGMVAEYCAERGHDYLLPLPSYFAYEDAAVRRGVTEFGYYGPAGVHGTEADPGCLYVNDPCAITGRRLVPPPGVLGTADLTVLDLVYQMQDLGRRSARDAARSLVRTVQDRSAVMVTTSKDLSLPGLRVGALVTKDEGLRAFSAQTQFERYYTQSPVVGLVATTYLALLVLAHEAASPATVRAVLGRYGALASSLDTELVEGFGRHRAAMLDHYRRAGELVAEYAELFPSVDDELPEAGYSCLLSLDEDIVGTDRDLARTAIRVLAHDGLRLNPARMFGGDRAAWEALYGTAGMIRVNLSEELPALRSQLDALRAALSGTSRRSLSASTSRA